jgi:hypothetical protein
MYYILKNYFFLMKDIFKSYKRENIIRNSWIVLSSLIIALSINFFIFDFELWRYWKTNILERTDEISRSDLYLEVKNDIIYLKISKNIKKLKTISFAFAYNPENTTLSDINSNLSKTTLTNISNEPWLNTIIINFDTPLNIEKNTSILSLETSKKQEQTEWLTIINANFTDDSWENYLLSTSWIMF